MKTINSIEDLNGLKRNEQIQYVCKHCGKNVVRQFRNGRIDIIKRFLCAQCNLKQSMIDKYGAATTLQSPELRAKVAATKKKLYGNEHYVNLEKAKRTMRDRYGVESYTVASDFQEKSKATMNAKYGVDYAAQNKDIYSKVKATNKAKYGKESYTSTEEFKEKSKQTNLAKRGVEHVAQSEEFRERVKQIMIDKYGAENPFSVKEIQEKAKQKKIDLYGDPYYNNREKAKATMMNNYGVNNPMKDVDIREKALQTCYERYGRVFNNAKYAYNGEKFDSSWELALWIYAKDHGEDIEHDVEPLLFELNGKIRHYFPDFIYKGELIEIKGNHFIDEDGNLFNPFDPDEDNTIFRAKQQCALENDVRFMLKNDIWFAIEYVRQKFNGDHQWYNQFIITPQHESNETIEQSTIPPVQLTPLLPMMPMYIYPTIPMMLPWWMFMTPCDFNPYSNNVFEREGMEFVDCECEYE